MMNSDSMLNFFPHQPNIFNLAFLLEFISHFILVNFIIKNSSDTKQYLVMNRSESMIHSIS